MRCFYSWGFWSKHYVPFLCFLFTVLCEEAPDPLPTFTNTPTNATTRKGSVAVLRCGIENLGTKTVTWRKLPYDVPITIGEVQYLEHNRFKLYRVTRLGEWNLHIKNAQVFDSGTYECQVSSREGLIRRNITLTVTDIPSYKLEPSIRINGTQFVEKGSPIHLVCNVSEQQDPPQSLDWFKDGRRLETSYDSNVFVQLQVSLSDKIIISTLDINKARMSDTGVYVCRASQKLATRIKVDVLNAETSNEKRDTNSGGALVYSNSGGCGILSSHFVFLLTITCNTLIVVLLNENLTPLILLNILSR